MPQKEAVHTTAAPAAIGPYSQGVKAGRMVFVSGQLPINVGTGKMPAGITDQTMQALKNVRAVLRASGLTLSNVVRCDVFLDSMTDFPGMNAVYAKFFTSNVPPARQTVEVSRLPKDALVEISCIAVE